jgi:hypothetical protein
MAKAKLTLAVAATFKATVSIPVAGGKSADVEFIFKHRTRDDFKEFMETLAGAEDVDALMDIASGWDLDEPFGKDAVEKLVQRYMGSARAVLDVYLAELTGARAKN